MEKEFEEQIKKIPGRVVEKTGILRAETGQCYQLVINRVFWFGLRIIVFTDERFGADYPIISVRTLDTHFESCWTQKLSEHSTQKGASDKLKYIRQQMTKSPFNLLIDVFGEERMSKQVFVPLLESKDLFDHPDLYLRRGDNIQVWRGKYHHAGVYLGNSRIIHVVDPNGGRDKTKSLVDEKTWLEFCGNDKDFRVGLLYMRNLSPQQVVQKAQKMMGELEGDYNALSKNCQDFSYNCQLSEEMERLVKSRFSHKLRSSLGAKVKTLDDRYFGIAQYIANKANN